jgi:translocation protein SEC63
MAKVLLFYGVIVGIGLPYMVNRWWQNARKYSRDKILNVTMEIYYQELKETMNFHKILEILSASVEFKEGLSNRPEDIETMPKVSEEGGFVFSNNYVS